MKCSSCGKDKEVSDISGWCWDCRNVLPNPKAPRTWDNIKRKIDLRKQYSKMTYEALTDLTKLAEDWNRTHPGHSKIAEAQEKYEIMVSVLDEKLAKEIK